jgi:predicted HTH transcriptional regulator
MNPLTDIQLAALLGDLESDRVERKEAWSGSAPEKAREAVCAFANDLPNHQQPGRNPHIAEALRVPNLVQRFGVGISIAQSSLRANGNPPAFFQVEPTTIFARIKSTSSAP